MSVVRSGKSGQEYCGDFQCGLDLPSCPSYGIGGNCTCPTGGGTCEFKPTAHTGIGGITRGVPSQGSTSVGPRGRVQEFSEFSNMSGCGLWMCGEQ